MLTQTEDDKKRLNVKISLAFWLMYNFKPKGVQ